MLLESLRQQVLEANQEIARRGLAPHTFGNASGIDRTGGPAPGRHQAQRSRLRHPHPGRLGDYRPRRQDRRGLTFAPPAISTPTPCSTANSPRSAASSTPTPNSLPPGPSPAAPFPAWEPPMPTTSMARFPSPKLSPPKKCPRATSAIPALSSSAASAPRPRPGRRPGVLVAGHAPFAWGKTPAEAVEHADVLEYIARLAFRTALLNSAVRPIPTHVSEHHYLRKHGPKATYGQR